MVNQAVESGQQAGTRNPDSRMKQNPNETDLTDAQMAADLERVAGGLHCAKQSLGKEDRDVRTQS